MQPPAGATVSARMKVIRTLAIPAILGMALAGAVPAIHAQAADDNSQSGEQQKPSGGTLKGAAVGAAAGHVMGGHTKTGAAVGAIAGHHERAKSEQQIQNNQKQ